MFFLNKYTKWYYNIINNRIKNPVSNCYVEKHHIIPKCLGGVDDKNNLVKLTAREHFVCHLLLTKMIDDSKINYAFIAMVNLENDRQNRNYNITSKVYDRCKKINAEEASKRFSGVKRKTGGRWYHNIYTMEEKIYYDTDIIGNDYVLGISPKRKGKIGKSNKSKIYYHNPISGETIAINKGDRIPENFVKGNPKAKTNLGKVGKKSYYDTITSKVVKKYPINKLDTDIECKFITIFNQILNTESRICEFDSIPDGWVIGRKKITGKNKIDIFATPFGEYSHILRFCEERCIDISVFKDMNVKFNPKAKNVDKLIVDLINLGLDVTKTKKELNFYKIKDKDD